MVRKRGLQRETEKGHIADRIHIVRLSRLHGHYALLQSAKADRPLERLEYERLENQRMVKIDPNEALAALREAGIEVEDATERLIDISEENSTTPKAPAEIILKAAKPVRQELEAVPAAEQSAPFAVPYSGLGRMTLREYAGEYETDLEKMLSILRENGMDIDPDTKLKEESARFDTDPEGIILLLNKSVSGAKDRAE